MARQADKSYSSRTELNWTTLVRFASSQWRMALVMTGVFVILAGLIEVLVVPYKLRAEVLINDAQTSQLQAFSNNFFELSKMQTTSRRNASASARAVDTLSRPESFDDFASRLRKRFQNDQLAPEVKQHASIFLDQMGSEWLTQPEALADLTQWLRSQVQLTTQGPSEIGISVRAANQSIAHLIGVEYSLFVVYRLHELEIREMNQIRSALEKQRDHFKAEFTRLNQEYIQFQTQPNNVLSLASGDNIANYLSDLMIRKNEIELKISENLRTIEFLGGKKAAQLAMTRGLGQRSHIQHLLEGTELLKKQASVIQDSINQFTQATSGSAEVARIADELKKSSDREFKNFQESNDLLSKLGVIESAIAQKFELPRIPHLEEVKKAVAPRVIFGIGIIVAQLVFSVWVFFLWKECWERAMAQSRNGSHNPPRTSSISLVRSPSPEL